MAQAKTKSTKQKKSKRKVSTDLSAEGAIKYIESTSRKKLKGFVPEAEDRTTVIEAYQIALASNKDLVYLAWKDGEKDAEKLHEHVEKAVKLSTIKNWLRKWDNDNGLPQIAKD